MGREPSSRRQIDWINLPSPPFRFLFVEQVSEKRWTSFKLLWGEKVEILSTRPTILKIQRTGPGKTDLSAGNNVYSAVILGWDYEIYCIRPLSSQYPFFEGSIPFSESFFEVLMTFEVFVALTPYITFTAMVGVGVVGWLLRRLIAQNIQLFDNLKQELKNKIDERSTDLGNRIDKMERDLGSLEQARVTDQKYSYERFVTKENYHRTVGRLESSVGRIFKLINELSKAVHQSLGASKNHGP